MRVTKQLRFEAAHRIPWHEGACRHLHGHSYGLSVTLEGEVDHRGMVIDFREIKTLLTELIDRLDHAVLAAESDTQLIAAVEGLGGKLCILPYDSTAENLCRFVADHLLREAGSVLAERGVTGILVRVRETATCYAELAVPLEQASSSVVDGSVTSDLPDEFYHGPN